MTKKETAFNELINFHPPAVKDWLIEMDKLLMDSGCKAAVDSKGNFTYTAKQTKKIICRITIKETGCLIRPNTSNVTSANSIAPKLPENMLNIMRSTRGCGGCEKKNPNFIQCSHGGPYRLTYENEDFESCRYVGFNFEIEDASNRNVLKKWIELELLLEAA